MEYRILHIEDSKTDADLVKRLISKSGLNASYHLASDKNEVNDALDHFDPNVILCDHSLPSFNSRMAYTICKDKNPDLTFILVTGTVSEEFAVEMLKSGVDDYLLKTNLQRLPVAVENAFSKRESDKKLQTFRNSLQQSETHLRTIFENSSNALLLLNKDFIIIESNSLMAEYSANTLGYSYKIGQNILEVLTPERRKVAKNNFEKVLNGDVVSYETVYNNEDKTGYIFYLVKMNPVKDSEGKIDGICISITDISEQKKAENIIRKSEKKYRDLIEQASDAIFIYSVDGTIYEFNKTCYTMLGYTQDEYDKLAMKDILASDIIVSRENHATLHAGETKTLKRILMRKDGSLLETEVSEKMLEDGKIIAFARDITERQKAEQEKKQLTERLLLATQSAKLGIWDWDIQNNLLTWDDGMYKLYNVSEAEFTSVYEGWISRLHPDDRQRVDKDINLAIKDKQEYKPEFRIVWPDSSVHYINASGIIARDSNGNAIRMIGVNWEVTEQKLAEKEIRDYKNALDESSMVEISDRDGIIRKVNKYFCRVSKYTAVELIGQSHRIINSGYHTKKFFRDLWNTVGEGKIWKNEVKNRAKDGSFFWTDTTIVPFLDIGGKPFQYITIRSNITKRKNAEARMAEAIEKYDTLAKATSDTIWDWDIVNNKTIYNDGIREMFGYKSSDVEDVVDWWNSKLHPEDYRRITNALKEVFEKKLERFQWNYRFRCANGSYKYIFDRAFVIFDEEGKPCRMIGAMEDITYQSEENIRVTKAILDAQEEERNKLGAELHDNINQILAGTLLTLGMAKAKEANARQRAGFIKTAIGYISDAINETRNLSHGLALSSFEDNTLKDLFEKLLGTLNLKNNINVVSDIEDLKDTFIPQNIKINLYRILQEQTKNILKYSKADTVEVSVKILNNNLGFRIFDNGKGFDPKVKKTGIGLNSIRKRSEALSGTFILNTAPGEGCEIIVEIPLDK